MKRIMVIGVSSGVGKSTFARELGKKLGISVTHLDGLFWEPNWKEAKMEEFTHRQQEVIAKESWIIEGNYTNTFDLRLAAADTIIYLELPLFLCLFRVLKRFFTHMGKTRADIGVDCKEKIDYEFLSFILTTYSTRKKDMNLKLKELTTSSTTKKIILLKNKKEIRDFLKS